MRKAREAGCGSPEPLESDLQAVSRQVAAFGGRTFRRELPAAAELISLLRRQSALLKQLLLLEQRVNDRLGEANERLRHDRSRLRLELQRALGFKPKGKSPPVLPATSGRRRDAGKRGAPPGHRGASRPVPAAWDAERLVLEPGSCQCGCKQVMALDEYDDKYVEDIVPARRTVTRWRFRRWRCVGCGRLLRHPAAAGPPVATGDRLATHLAVLRQSGTTYRQLARICQDTLGLPVTASGVMGIVNRISDRLNPSYEQLAASLPGEEILHADETGWKVRKDLHFLWVMCNPGLAFFHADKSRSAAVPENLLGADFAGTAVCDFYAGYNFLKKTQRCLVHLLRDIKKERELLPASLALQQFEARVKGFIEQGKLVRAMADGPERADRAASLRKELGRIGQMRMPAVGRGEALAKRILKYQDDLFRFVEDPRLEWHNNRAERQIRPLVVSRKMSFGSDTIEGARRNCVLHSVIATCKLRGIKPLEFIGETLAGKRPDILASRTDGSDSIGHNTS